MKLKQIIISVLLLIVAALGGGTVANNLGSSYGDATSATSTSSFAIPTVGSFKVLKTGPGVLSKVVITNETAGAFNLYDATSTNHGDHATTTLINVYANMIEGSHELNIAFARGLIVEFQSTNVASSTIGFR